MRRRLLITACGNLVLALVWFGLWFWRPANWWNLALGVGFAVFAAAILIDLRRRADRPA